MNDPIQEAENELFYAQLKRNQQDNPEAQELLARVFGMPVEKYRRIQMEGLTLEEERIRDQALNEFKKFNH